MIALRIFLACLLLLVLPAAARSAGTTATDGPDGEPAGAPSGCSPLSGGMETFPSTATLVINDQGFGEPFVVHLSSAGLPDAVVQRAPQVGDIIDTEILQLELSGFHPRLGAIVLRESATVPSVGQIGNVVLDGSCELAQGDATFDLFVELELPGLVQTWVHDLPIQLVAGLTQLPPTDVRFEVPFVQPLTLRDASTADERGTLFYAMQHTSPSFPPPGADCFDSLLTAELHLFSPEVTANLIGFGPTTVERGTTTAGGVCNGSGLPCEDSFDCLFLDVCLTDRLETETTQLDLGGFDLMLGSWSMSVLPGGGTSDCCTDTGSPGCSDPGCEDVICAMDNFCCDVEWDLLCSQLALGEPICADNCLDPDANPSFGAVTSVGLDRTYPAVATFDLFFRIETDQQGTLHNDVPLHLQPAAAVGNVPPAPGTEYLYASTPRAVLDADDVVVGEISNVVHTIQTPADCAPPPAAAEDCIDSWLLLQLTLPPCDAELVWLQGGLRSLRDDPGPGAGFGQDQIDHVLARAEFSGVAACAGPLTARLSSAAAGAVSSLTPEEFFPADSFFDVQIELETALGLLTAGPTQLSTSINALPPDAGETYFGPDAPLDLFDASLSQVGQILEVAIEVQTEAACPADWSSAIRFTGPTHEEFSVAIPDGGAGIDYDVVRGDLNALRTGNGTFSSATCLLTDVDATVSDSATPATGQGFYYVSRDGLGAFNGTWNGTGAAQQADRDPDLPDCP